MSNYDQETHLLRLLTANSRESIAELARKLCLSRSTVKDKISRLEKRGIIKGYTLRVSEDYKDRQLEAQVMISCEPKLSMKIGRALSKLSSIRSLYTFNGAYDMIAIVNTNTTKDLDHVLDEIGDIEGINKTLSSIVLSTKFER